MADLLRRYRCTSLLLLSVVVLLYIGILLSDWTMGLGVSAGMVSGGGWIARWDR
jgi:hypothetical protein